MQGPCFSALVRGLALIPSVVRRQSVTYLSSCDKAEPATVRAALAGTIVRGACSLDGSSQDRGNHEFGKDNRGNGQHAGNRHAGGGGARCSRGVRSRKYLLERVEEAAVVQLYADGFYRAAARAEDPDLAPLPGGAGGARHLLRPALRPQPGDARRPRRDRHARSGHRRRRRSTEIQRYTKLFWLNTGPYNNLTARKFVLKCTPEAFAAAAHARGAGRRTVPARGRARRSTPC